MPVALRQCGLLDYATAYAQMRAFTDARTAQTPDEIWLCQHPPVYTQGQAGRPGHILSVNAIPVIQTDRGGQEQRAFHFRTPLRARRRRAVRGDAGRVGRDFSLNKRDIVSEKTGPGGTDPRSLLGAEFMIASCPCCRGSRRASERSSRRCMRARAAAGARCPRSGLSDGRGQHRLSGNGVSATITGSLPHGVSTQWRRRPSTTG